jgi:signal transduction histidine kinase
LEFKYGKSMDGQLNTGGIAKGARILIADDDPVLRELATNSLSNGRFQVETASDGLEAIHKLGESKFDLLITDLSMPGADGFDVINAVRLSRESRHMPVIVMTTSDDYVSIERAFAAGATSFCAKPINWTLLDHHVRYVLRASKQEDEMRLARRAAESASQLKSNLLSVVTHEFRTPLHQILGFTKLLVNEIEGPLGAPGYKDYAGHIHEAAGGLNRLLSDMLLLTRSLANELQIQDTQCPLRDLIEGAIERVTAGKQTNEVVIVDKMPGGRDTLLLCDTNLIMRALEHIIENALKFSPDGAQVHVMAMLAESGAVILTVQDTGPGIEAARVNDLMQPFKQGDMSFCRSKEGLGIGLAIAKIAADGHGGRLLIHSEPGSVTTVGMVLPASRLVSDRESESELSAESATAR